MALRIGELARQAGLAASALRYYEEVGLLEPSSRTESGYRLYGEEALGRLGFIRRAQSLGLSVSEIRELLANRTDNETDRARLRHVVAHKLAATQTRLNELTTLKDELQAQYVRLLRGAIVPCGHLGDCACWLPNEKEVTAMAADIKTVQDCGCSDCPEPGCDCNCGCCATG